MDNDNIVKQALTENDGVSWCVVRIVGTIAIIELLIFYAIFNINYPQSFASTLLGFGACVSAILGAMVVKNVSERIGR
jgi:hypothetical protein